MSDPMAGVLALAAAGAIGLAVLAAVAVRRRRSRPESGSSAARLAELLLLEISLGRPDELDAARREQRILHTFAAELARARITFEARFPPGTPGWPEFDLAIVRTLAGGDGAALGPRQP